MDLNDPDNAQRITGVLLPDGWHTIRHDSFEIEPWKPSGVPGFSFLTGDEEIAGPLTSILATRQE